ncbi:MAG: response regulator [Rhodoferax sp.]|uniref:response regulator n=1 Tax=Rhodoferax sp. TaxID=50421 RepID=UPI00261546E5|nr:response regulator [Rhodoferax sp.]MDD2882087.1 response regulator [Rhodoferax sp.]
MTPPNAMPSVKPRVLVVEDELVVARDIAQQLLDMGYSPVGTTHLGEHAVMLAAELLPDLVLMDIQLAGAMDGIEAAQEIRSRLAVPVVFLTAFAADDVLARAKVTEPFGYILKPFSERELSTVLAMALYKHQAEARLQATTRQLKALSRRVLEAQEQERRRVALELHDELGQLLTAIKINLQLGERFKDKAPPELHTENLRIVEEALQQVRRLATGLRPSMLDDLGLAPALKWVAEQSASRGGFEVSFHHERTQVRLSPEIETACFRIVQEALTNISRHARATRVDITLCRDGADLLLTVKDDGQGFDLAAMQARAVAGGSLGVLGMQERATLLGGQLGIDSSPGQGCAVQLRAPWRNLEERV